MESLNPNQRLAEATLDHTEAMKRQNSLLQRAKTATHNPDEYDYSSHAVSNAEEQVKAVHAQNKFITQQSQVHGSGKSPLSTTMPLQGGGKR